MLVALGVFGDVVEFCGGAFPALGFGVGGGLGAGAGLGEMFNDNLFAMLWW
jgi:hypothetical protein